MSGPGVDEVDTRARLIAVNCLSQGVGGGVTVARNLVTALAGARPAARILLLCSSRLLGEADWPSNVDVRFRPELLAVHRRVLWEQLALPRLLRREGSQVLLGLGGFACFTTRVPQLSVWQNPNIITRSEVGWSRSLRLYIAMQRWAQAWSMRKATSNVFLSRESVREASSWWRMDRIPHVVIHNGIVPGSPPAGGDASRDRDLVLAVGHAYVHKNYETLIDAMAELAARPGSRLRLEIAGGPIDAAHYARLQERVASSGLDSRIRFLGPRSAPEIADLYDRAWVFVTVSLLESFGLTPLEAMSHGLPVLASSASVTPEICGDAALYCDPRSVADVAERIAELAADASLRERLRSAGLRRAREFGWERLADAYLRQLDACLRQHGADGGSWVPEAGIPGGGG